MNRTRLQARASMLIGFVLLWSVASLLAGLLTPDLHDVRYRNNDANQGMSLLDRLFGSTRAAISQGLLMEADRYFHRGVGHVQNRRHHLGLFRKWTETISPSQHAELQGADIEEMMPWLRFATLSDPHNVDAYITTAFWLSRQGQPARVVHVLNEAEENNPGDYRVFMAKGYYFFENFFVAAALENYERALQLWPGGLDETSRQVLLDRAQILTFTGALYELNGNTDSAAKSYQQVLALYPDRNWMKERIAALQHGDIEGSKTFWRGVLQSQGITGAPPPPTEFAPHERDEHGSHCSGH